MDNLELKIDGMACGGCSSRLTELLEKAPGIKKAEISHENGTGAIMFDPATTSQRDIIAIIEKAGFEIAA